MKKRLLVLDFDQTITDYNNTLSKERADRLAHMLSSMIKSFNMKIVILSMANKAHILGMILLSQSFPLIKLMLAVPMITIENRDMVYAVDKRRKESQKEKNRMITTVTASKYYNDSPDHVIAYKKTNELLHLAHQEGIHPQDIYFLDDNPVNIHFASHYNFHTYLVDNRPMYKNLRLFERLHTIQKNLNNYYYRHSKKSSHKQK